MLEQLLVADNNHVTLQFPSALQSISVASTYSCPHEEI